MGNKKVLLSEEPRHSQTDGKIEPLLNYTASDDSIPLQFPLKAPPSALQQPLEKPKIFHADPTGLLKTQIPVLSVIVTSVVFPTDL